MPQKAKILDVAKLSGVAKSTVSNVFSGKHFVSEKIKEKVIAACKELNYSPSYIAVTLKKKQTNLVGLFLESNSKEYYDYYNPLIQSIVSLLAPRGYRLIIYFALTSDNIDELLRLGGAPIDGAIVVAPKFSDKRIFNLSSHNIPFVLIGRPDESDQQLVSYIDVDNERACYEMTEHLIRFGHTAILFLNSDDTLTISQDRKNGYCKALTENGLENEPTLMRSGENNEAFGYHEVSSVLSRGESFSAIICSSDLVAYGVYKALQERNIQIGTEISVASMGGTKYLHSLSPKLASGSYDYFKLGEGACQILLSKFDQTTYSIGENNCFSINFAESVAQRKI